MINLSDYSIPTEPEEFDLEMVQQELVKIKELLPKLEAFDDLEYRDLSKKIQDECKAIRMIVPPTAGGIEKVNDIQWRLWNAETVCETVLNRQSAKQYIFNSMLSQTERSIAQQNDPSLIEEEVNPVQRATVSSVTLPNATTTPPAVAQPQPTPIVQPTQATAPAPSTLTIGVEPNSAGKNPAPKATITL